MRRNRLLIVSLFIVLLVTLFPGNGKIAENQLDKVIHFIIFFFLSLNISYKYFDTKKLFILLGLGILLGWLTEIIQQYIPGRNYDNYDIVADSLGIIFGYLLYTVNPKFLDRILIKLGA